MDFKPVVEYVENSFAITDAYESGSMGKNAAQILKAETIDLMRTEQLSTYAMHLRGWPRLIGCGHAPIRDLTYEVLGL